MSELYLALKSVHVAGVIVWLGGLVSMALANAYLVRAGDPAAVRVVLRQSAFFGKRVLGPAAGLTLLTGLVLGSLLRHFQPWMAWGLAAMVASMGLGATLLRRATMELARASATPDPDDAVGRARRRLALLHAVNLLVLASAVWAMVAKP